MNKALAGAALVLCCGCWENGSLESVEDVGDLRFVALDGDADRSTCGLVEDGSIRCWDQYGARYETLIHSLDEEVGILDVSIESGRGCALMGDGQVRCWQVSDLCHCGLPDPVERREEVTEGAVQISVGNMDMRGLRLEVFCWLDQDSVARCRANERGREPSELVIGLDDVVEVDAASGCAYSRRGELSCIRPDLRGLGDLSALGGRYTFEPVAGLAPVRDIAGSTYRSCAVTEAGRVLCWPTGQVEMAADQGVEGMVQVAVSETHACAVDDASAVWCWGDTGLWQQGARGGAYGIDAPPSPIEGETARSVTVGWRSGCLLRFDDTVRCWSEPRDATPSFGLGGAG